MLDFWYCRRHIWLSLSDGGLLHQHLLSWSKCKAYILYTYCLCCDFLSKGHKKKATHQMFVKLQGYILRTLKFTITGLKADWTFFWSTNWLITKMTSYLKCRPLLTHESQQCMFTEIQFLNEDYWIGRLKFVSEKILKH